MSKEMKIKSLKKFIIIISLIFLSGFLYLYGFTYSKYISDSAWNYYLKSKGFYLSSDYLGSTMIKNVNNLWDGDKVYFNIKNNLNETVITNYDIEYRVECFIEGDAASYTECKMNGGDSNFQSGILSGYQRCVNNTEDEVDTSSFNQKDCEINGYEWVSDIAVKDLYFEIVLIDEDYEIKDIVVEVKVMSTSPYQKTLTGKFTLYKNEFEEGKLSLDFKNYSGYDKLIVINSHSTDKCVKIKWDADKLIINEDYTKFSSYSTNSNGYIKEIKFNIKAGESVSYKFFEKDLTSIYSKEEFTIEESIGCE